jgi:hypothetical protein
MCEFRVASIAKSGFLDDIALHCAPLSYVPDLVGIHAQARYVVYFSIDPTGGRASIWPMHCIR